MINEKPVAKIAELVDDAVTKGAKLLLGGQRLNRPGYYYPADRAGRRAGRCRHDEGRNLRTGGRRSVLRQTKTKRSASANDTEYGLAAYRLYPGPQARPARSPRRSNPA